jgi:hypothetical protein
MDLIGGLAQPVSEQIVVVMGKIKLAAQPVPNLR